ncbi:imelysin family protein [Halomonas halodenitrificans]|uniref:imelysin family protein n=1 Tax=Halomonas halodenitrificans TaxID=28252 RepID=UPI000687F365|nr:imelysin family protein [Halomonas halodenitrificans]
MSEFTPIAFPGRRGRAGLLALMMAGVAPAAMADAPSTARGLWHEAIGEGYAELERDARRLAEQAADYCHAPSPEGRASLESLWRDAYQAWQAVRFVNFGPIEQQSRGWQLQFWPDRKNLVGQKASIWLKADTPPNRQSIADDSVAIQGFPALEYLLFDDRMDSPDALAAPQACGLFSAITRHLETTTHQLHDDWQAFGDHYRETDTYTQATLEAGLQALETMETRRLAAPLGLSGKPANAYLAEAWRSRQSVLLIGASLAGLEQAYLPGLRPLLHQAGQEGLYDDFATRLHQAQANVDDIEGDDIEGGIAHALEDPAAFSTLQGLYIDVSQLNWMGREIASALGIARGFNATDGD